MTDGGDRHLTGALSERKEAPRWRRVLRISVWFVGGSVLGMTGFIGALVFKYQRVVNTGPGTMGTTIQPTDHGRWVDPFIGTGGIPWVCGNNFPGAMVPFGTVRLGPETASMVTRTRALNTSGYFYGDDRVLGFSHTRLNGTGATDGGHFLVAPSLKPVDMRVLRRGRRFSHRDEVASPGYYGVHLPEIGTLVELTATARVGVHRYTFDGRGPAHLHLDVSNALGGRRSTDGKLRVWPEKREIEGHIRTFGTFAGRYGGLKVYFVARTDRPFATFNTWRGERTGLDETTVEGDGVGVDLVFGCRGKREAVTLKLAVSHVSVANARANLEAEGEGEFDAIVLAAQKNWEDRLSRIKVLGGTEKQRRIFYTALFRTFQMPTLFTDASGEYWGFDQKVHKVAGHLYYTDLSLWDTFRTVHPLYTLIAPEEQRDMILSLLTMQEQGGWLPRWPAGAGYSNSMLGTPADIVIAEAYLKGVRGFDIEAAYRAMRQTALGPVPSGSAFSGREGVEHYLEYGYCPSDLMPESVARTFEFGWADSAISLLAEALRHPEDAELFQNHSRFYRHLWNPQNQYFQPRDSEGTFSQPFKPLLLTYFDRKGSLTRDYVEGSALQWRWAAPFDAPGMIALFKSRDYFVEELDRFFARSNPARGRWNPGPYYWHGNQPDIHAAYLFNEAGRPDLTQKWVRWILENKYGDGYDGLDGNDDGGTLSAWYVFSALGLYPIAGSDLYQLGAPLFEKAEMKMGTNNLIFLADNFASNHPYVEKVWLNDAPLDRAWIRHKEIQDGGTLRFRVSRDAPSARCGSSPTLRSR